MNNELNQDNITTTKVPLLRRQNATIISEEYIVIHIQPINSSNRRNDNKIKKKLKKQQ